MGSIMGCQKIMGSDYGSNISVLITDLNPSFAIDRFYFMLLRE